MNCSVALASAFCLLCAWHVCFGSTTPSEGRTRFGQVSLRNGFTLNGDELDWREAFKECKDWKATLAYPKSAKEGATLRSFLINSLTNATKEIHLGFHNLFSKDNYTTVQGYDMDEYGYRKWDPESQNDTDQRCGAMTVDGMKTVDCDTRMQSICLFPGTSTFDKIEGFGYYHLFDLNLNWTHAVTLCKMETANLLMLRSGAEYDAVFKHYSEAGVVVNGTMDILYGAHQLYADRWFLTIADEPLEDSGYSLWAPDEPADVTRPDYPVVGLRLTDMTAPEAEGGMFVHPAGTPLPAICKRELH